MPEKMTDREWAAKALYEGGVIEAFEYGLKPDDLAPDGDPDFLTAVNKAYAGWYAARDDIVVLDDLIDEMAVLW